jgi:hypothetical protein
MQSPFYFRKKLGIRRRLIPFTKNPYLLHFRLTLEHQERLFALVRETGKSIDDVVSAIFILGLMREKDEAGRTDKVYYDPDMDYNDYYDALLVRGFAAYDARKKGSDLSDTKMLAMLLDPKTQNEMYRRML